MRVVITGATGFVGGRAVTVASRRGFSVVAAHRSGEMPVLTGVVSTRVDVSTPDGVSGLPDRADVLLHLAATSPAPGIGVARLIGDNLGGMDALLTWAKRAGVRRVVFASSMSVYGDVSVDEVDENTPTTAPSPYGATKLLGEAMLAERAGSFSALALRLPGIIGPGCRANFLSQTLARLIAHEPIRPRNPDGMFNNAVHVDELADFLLNLAEREWTGFDIVTLAAAGASSLRAAINRMAVGVGSRSDITWVDEPPRAFSISIRRAVERFGYAPSTIDAMLDRFTREATEKGARTDG